MMPKKGGFTLLEVVVVVVIIAILATIALPSYTNQLHASKASRAVAALTEIRKANISYFYRTTTFTDDVTSLRSEAGGGIVPFDGDWTYSIFSLGLADTYVATARRESGPYSGDTITLDDFSRWGGTYTGPGAP